MSKLLFLVKKSSTCLNQEVYAGKNDKRVSCSFLVVSFKGIEKKHVHGKDKSKLDSIIGTEWHQAKGDGVLPMSTTSW